MSVNVNAVNTAIDTYINTLVTQEAPADVEAIGQARIGKTIKQHLLNGRERERSALNTTAIKKLLSDIAAALA